MPRFSANLGFLWPELPLLERIDAAGKAGFRAVEMHWPYDEPEAALREACARNGLTLLGLNTPRGDVAAGENGLGAVPGREEAFRADFDRAAAYAEAVGATAMHVMAGFVPPEQQAHGERTFLDNLAYAAAKAEGLTLLLEPLNPRDAPGYFYHTLAEAAGIIEKAGIPALKIMFDVYHVGVTEGDVLTKLRRYAGLIGHVQIAAVPSRAEPDEGEIAYRAIFDELDRLGYAGWVGCEYKPRGKTGDGLSWTETLGVCLAAA